MTITKHETGSSLAIRDDQEFWSDKQLAALRQLGVGNARPGDLAVFFHQVQRTGLDPFARQIYMIERQGKQTIQTGIDGFRLIGRRAADAKRETLEVSDTEWCGKDGKWVDVWLSDEHPAAARVAVIRNGGRFPAVALWSEYVATKRDGSVTQMWATKGALMLAKCAEALAWRKAYPQDLSGLYTSDEMQQADNGGRVAVRQQPDKPHGGVAAALADARAQQPTPTPVSAASPPSAPEPEGEGDGITDAQMKKMRAVMGKVKLTDRAETLAFAARVIGREIASSTDLTKSEAGEVIDALEAWESMGADPTTGVVSDPIDAELVDDESNAQWDEAAR